MTAWMYSELGDLVDVFDRIRVPLSAAQRAERQGQYPYYGAQGIIDYIDDYLFEGRYLLIPEDGENLNSRKLPIAYFAEGRFWVNNHAHIVRAKRNIADDVFLKHALNALDIKGYITGAAQPKLTQANMRRMMLRIPCFDQQRRIAAILGAYDDLIEVNRRRVALLESMARSLYEEWFVRFRFPGHEKVAFVDTLGGPLPEGWSLKIIRDVTSFVSRGLAPRYDETSSSLVLNQKCIRDQRLSIQLARRQSKVVPAEKVVRAGDILINSTGVGTLGRVAQAEEVPEGLTVDSHVTIVRPLLETDCDFLGMQLLRLQPSFEDMGTGATGQTELSRSAIGAVKVTWPTVEFRTRFRNHVRPTRALVSKLMAANLRLVASRDLLLPRLISGQLSVRAAERELLKAA